MVIKQIWKKRSIAAFFKGNGTNVLKIVPETSIKFFSYDYAKTLICKNKKEPKFYESLACGAIAGVTG